MSMYRTINIVTLLVFVFSGFACSEKEQIAKIEKITLHCVDLQVETPFRISCEDFDDLFSSSYKTIVITENKQLSEFGDYLSHCKVLNSVKKIDVRVKATIQFSNRKTSILCMDQFGNLILDGKSIDLNQNIANFIKGKLVGN